MLDSQSLVGITWVSSTDLSPRTLDSLDSFSRCVSGWESSALSTLSVLVGTTSATVSTTATSIRGCNTKIVHALTAKPPSVGFGPYLRNGQGLRSNKIPCVSLEWYSPLLDTPVALSEQAGPPSGVPGKLITKAFRNCQRCNDQPQFDETPSHDSKRAIVLSLSVSCPHCNVLRAGCNRVHHAAVKPAPGTEPGSHHIE